MSDTPETNTKVEELLAERRDRFESRREARLENASSRAAKNRKLSTNFYQKSRSMGNCIPFGQPILVGHHSEGRDRRFRSRMRGAMDKSIEAGRTADYYESKVTAIESNTAIFSDDPDAIDKLKAKLAAAQRQQEFWKEGNKIIKSKKLSPEEKAAKLTASGHCPSIATPDRYNRVGYADYLLTNNNGNMRRMRLRIAELETALVAAVEIGDTAQKYPEIGLTIRQARTIDRIQLVFKGKPNEAIRTYLKRQGFNWAPSEGCWQRKLGNGYYDVRLIEEITKLTQTAKDSIAFS
jgi:Domain of unknown function (DUF3560)